MVRLAPLRRAAARAAVSLGTLTLAACTLLVATDDLATSAATRGADAGGVADATAPSPSPSPSDGAVDASRADGGTPDADSGTKLSYCSSLSPAPAFCVDFDDGRPLTAFGTVVGTPSPTLDPTIGHSGSASMLLDIPASTTNFFQSAIETALTGSFNSYAVSCSLRMDPATTAAYTEVVSFRFVSGGDRYSFLLFVNNLRIQLAEQHGPTGTETSAAIGDAPLPSTASGWVTIRFAGTLGIVTAAAQLYVEGVKVSDQPLNPAPSGPGTAPDIMYGIYYSGQNQPAKRFDMDDVVVDLH